MVIIEALTVVSKHTTFASVSIHHAATVRRNLAQKRMAITGLLLRNLVQVTIVQKTTFFGICPCYDNLFYLTAAQIEDPPSASITCKVPSLSCAVMLRLSSLLHDNLPCSAHFANGLCAVVGSLLLCAGPMPVSSLDLESVAQINKSWLTSIELHWLLQYL